MNYYCWSIQIKSVLIHQSLSSIALLPSLHASSENFVLVMESRGELPKIAVLRTKFLYEEREEVDVEKSKAFAVKQSSKNLLN